MRASPATHHASIGEHHFQTEHVMPGDAVFKTLRASRVGGDIAADAAVFQTGRIGRIKKSFLHHCILKNLIDHSGLDSRLQIPFVNLNDFIEPIHGNDHSAMNRQSAPTQTCSGATRRDRNIFFITNFKNGRDLFCIRRT